MGLLGSLIFSPARKIFFWVYIFHTIFSAVDVRQGSRDFCGKLKLSTQTKKKKNDMRACLFCFFKALIFFFLLNLHYFDSESMQKKLVKAKKKPYSFGRNK